MAIENDISENQSETILLLKQRLSKFETEEGRLHGLSYVPTTIDIGISTSPKAGTTWVQQICHQIRCALVAPESCMDFDEISSVVPWIELAFDLDQNLLAEQPPYGQENAYVPRLFKTHCWYDHCPKFPKTIVVLRDPYDVLVSFFNFFEGWFFEPGSIDLDTFAEAFWLARSVPDSKMQNASYFVHLVSWYNVRHGDDSSKILFLFFEDLQDDLEREVRRIAKFMSNDHHNFNTENVVRHAVNHSTFNFMKQNQSKFDEKLTKRGRNEICGLPRNAGMCKSKVDSGKMGKGRSILSDNIIFQIEKKWNDVVYPVTQCKSYAELRLKLHDEWEMYKR